MKILMDREIYLRAFRSHLEQSGLFLIMVNVDKCKPVNDNESIRSIFSINNMLHHSNWLELEIKKILEKQIIEVRLIVKNSVAYYLQFDVSYNDNWEDIQKICKKLVSETNYRTQSERRNNKIDSIIEAD